MDIQVSLHQNRHALRVGTYYPSKAALFNVLVKIFAFQQNCATVFE